MGVALLLALIWAVVLVPPALRSHAARKEAFVLSFGGHVPPPVPRRPVRARSPAIQRRRRIAGGLLVDMAATLLIGLLPAFRVMLIAHLFLVDSFLAYIALLARKAQLAAPAWHRGAVAGVAPLGAPEETPRWRRPWRTALAPRRAVLPELRPVGRLG